jgi:hypothetical protein
MTVLPETLLAFIDGELSPEEARRVAAEVANDPALAAHTEKHRALKARLQAASLPITTAAEPSSAAAIVAAAPQGASASADSPPEPRPNSGTLATRGWIAVGAMAIGIGLGVLLAVSFRPATEMRTEGGKVAAQGPLAVALSRQLAAEENEASGATRVAESFFSNDGYFCRTFTTSGTTLGDAGNALAGIACREGGEWRIKALSATPPPDAGKAPELPASVRAVSDSMMVGKRLDAEGERAARAQGWIAK